MGDNKDVVRAFVERLWNQRRLELADTIIARDCHTHQLRSGALLNPVPRGPGALKAHISEWVTGFPDLRFTIEQMLAEGDRVFTQLVMDGTHTGPCFGIPPTGKHVSLRMMIVHRIQHGKIIEDWVLVESLGAFQQLGVLPSTTDFVAEFARRAPMSK
jgi:steroid delta-isomerase-like uncharacterized protein